jgi:hypothetical protein
MNDSQFKQFMKELKIVKKLLIASLYSSGISSENLAKVSGMDSADIRKLISKRKIKGGKNAEKD